MMPLDLSVWPDGRLVIVGRMAGDTLVVSLTGDQLVRLRAAVEQRGAVLELRRSHFQTCPNADEFRRR
jgi:hypothetical protein